MDYNDLQSALDYLRNLKVESDKTILINIDDLLTTLHMCKRAGYQTSRVPKRAIWQIKRGIFVQEIYVDTTRKVPRNQAFLLPKPQFKPEIKIEPWTMPDIAFGYRFGYGFGSLLNATVYEGGGSTEFQKKWDELLRQAKEEIARQAMTPTDNEIDGNED